jgi:hypothetical protein
MPQTITYRGPRVLLGALAHLLREEDLEFKQPREDRTEVVEVAVVVLEVRAGDKVLDRTLDAMIDAAVARFKKRSTSWQWRDLATLSETDSLNCVGGPLSGQEGALTWNGGAADDLARQHGCRPGSVARCVGGRTECSSASTQDRLIALIRLDPLPRSPTCTPSNPPWLD